MFLFPIYGHGSVVFSEIMYDLEGSDTNEWVEVQNTSTEDIDISGWKLFENNVNHTLKIFNGDIVLKAGEYAIIANDANAFLNAYPNVSFAVFDSVFSLSNTGEQLVLRNDLNVDKDTFSYTNGMGGNGDGNSLQKIGNSWGSGQPTPGLQNSWSQVAGTSTEETNNNSSNNENNSGNVSGVNKVQSKLLSIYTSPIREFDFLEPKFAVNAGPDRITAVGNSVEFKAETNEENLNEGRGASFSWSFGDGSMKYGSNVTYSYRTSGEYIVVVNAEKGQFESADQILVKVIDPKISLSQDGTGNIIVTNKSDDDINLYQWKISHLGKEFVFPKDTIILKGKSITLHSEVTQLSVVSSVPPLLFDPRGLLHLYTATKQFSGSVYSGNISSSVPDKSNQLKMETDSGSLNATLVVDVENKKEVLGEKRTFWNSLKDVFVRLID